MNKPISISEEHGLEAIPASTSSIYSIGVSTAGDAEIRMAEADNRRHIIATTIDAAGADETRRRISQAGMASQIEVKLEDISEPLPYSGNTFDFAYARLILHYLTKQQLTSALSELHRILKPGSSLFAVVRSTKNSDCTERATGYDEHTGMTTHTTVSNEVRKRYFHTPESISGYLQAAGFTISHCIRYEETLFDDYSRTVLSPHADDLIEVLADK